MRIVWLSKPISQNQLRALINNQSFVDIKILSRNYKPAWGQFKSANIHVTCHDRAWVPIKESVYTHFKA